MDLIFSNILDENNQKILGKIQDDLSVWTCHEHRFPWQVQQLGQGKVDITGKLKMKTSFLGGPGGSFSLSNGEERGNGQVEDAGLFGE